MPDFINRFGEMGADGNFFFVELQAVDHHVIVVCWVSDTSAPDFLQSSS
jgi:hypothetical protein